jgi:hypothetical protein
MSAHPAARTALRPKKRFDLIIGIPLIFELAVFGVP